MGLPVTIYKSTDAGCTLWVILQNHLTWITIKKIEKIGFLEGYGDKLPLGWTLEL